eukprot:CAMPEP_0115150562 /NCGR_PEP_ID=MMETSP0227-20121206/65113_1 /TAXON_ID=89957 /ORGANISM="Polarella glacialis, Strain CCMP 1383" /LENGTH=600 /DNA_ID=CAMNT_0002560951 /DNA_START=95 /DNA_END=1897 /DNA_ORIENTATION=+
MLSSARAGRPRNNGNEPMQVGPVTEDSRAQTPVSRQRRANKQIETTPSTPSLEGNRLATPEVATLCPKPCRAFPGSPGGASLPDSKSVADECCQELRELLGQGGEAHRHMFDNGKNGIRHHSSGGDAVNHQVDLRPLSSVSTSAGPTPSPDGRTSPQTHGPGGERRAGGPGRQPEAGSKANGTRRQTDPAGGSKQAMPSQVRKIFVGGIPQDMGQDDLFKLFSEVAPVKKAWLQRYRDATKNSKVSSSHNHRGFGFVIFTDSSGVDQLLGKSFSRFLNTKDGRKLEVKRAVSSSDIDDVAPQTQEPNSKGGETQAAANAATSPSVAVAAPCPLSGHHLSGLTAVGSLASAPMGANGYCQQRMPVIPDGSGHQLQQAAALQQAAGLQQPAAMPSGCWPIDPRVAWMTQPAMQQQMQQNMMMAPAPWPSSSTGGANHRQPMPQNALHSPTAPVQQLFPAAWAGGFPSSVAQVPGPSHEGIGGVPLAAPIAVRAHNVVMSGQCGYSPQMPSPGMAWMPTSQTPPPLPMAGAMPFGADLSAPGHMQPMYNPWAQWAPVPGCLTPPPLVQQMQQPLQQPLHQQQNLVHSHMAQRAMQQAVYAVPQ